MTSLKFALHSALCGKQNVQPWSWRVHCLGRSFAIMVSPARFGQKPSSRLSVLEFGTTKHKTCNQYHQPHITKPSTKAPPGRIQNSFVCPSSSDMTGGEWIVNAGTMLIPKTLRPSQARSSRFRSQVHTGRINILHALQSFSVFAALRFSNFSSQKIVCHGNRNQTSDTRTKKEWDKNIAKTLIRAQNSGKPFGNCLETVDILVENAK